MEICLSTGKQVYLLAALVLETLQNKKASTMEAFLL
jgi:hypothetical protein